MSAVSAVSAVPTASSPLVIYSDGACIGNPGPGGWAWARDRSSYRSGFAASTTNQRMELTAALEAVSGHSGPLEIVSDSVYVVNCFRNRWWAGWRARGWRNAKGAEVANQDLWRPFVELVVDERPGEVRFTWVKGHSGHPMNDLVDGLANDAARRQVAAVSTGGES
ncbi:MAG TPA: ribonuclease H [Acidimicrobiales bacterium]|nr:ribonuclease H [Acidimicrobiales bacterium]